MSFASASRFARTFPVRSRSPLPPVALGLAIISSLLLAGCAASASSTTPTIAKKPAVKIAPRAAYGATEFVIEGFYVADRATLQLSTPWYASLPPTGGINGEAVIRKTDRAGPVVFVGSSRVPQLRPDSSPLLVALDAVRASPGRVTAWGDPNRPYPTGPSTLPGAMADIANRYSESTTYAPVSGGSVTRVHDITLSDGRSIPIFEKSMPGIAYRSFAVWIPESYYVVLLELVDFSGSLETQDLEDFARLVATYRTVPDPRKKKNFGY